MDEDGRGTPLALWLRDRRKRRGLTVRALAEKAGVSHPRISQIEGGDTATSDMILRLAEALAPENASEDERQAIIQEGIGAAFMPAGIVTSAVRSVVRDAGYQDDNLTPEDEAKLEELFEYAVIGLMEKKHRTGGRRGPLVPVPSYGPRPDGPDAGRRQNGAVPVTSAREAAG